MSSYLKLFLLNFPSLPERFYLHSAYHLAQNLGFNLTSYVPSPFIMNQLCHFSSWSILSSPLPVPVPMWALCCRPSLSYAWTIAVASSLVLLLLFLLIPIHQISLSSLMSHIIIFIMILPSLQSSSGYLWLKGSRPKSLMGDFHDMEGEFKPWAPP